MDNSKQNDIFALSVVKPDLSTKDMDLAGYTPDNTQLLSKDQYKNSEFAKKSFTDQTGNFNDKQFDEYYDKAASLYNDLSTTKYKDRIKNEIEYDPLSIYAPVGAKKRDIDFTITKVANPYHMREGISSNAMDESEFSVRELAQTNKV